MTTLHTPSSSSTSSTASSSPSSSTAPLSLLQEGSSLEHHRWTSLTSTLFLYGDNDTGKEPHRHRWWDESQLAVELADDSEIATTQTKKRSWYAKRTHTLRRFHTAGHKISRSFRRFTAGLV